MPFILAGFTWLGGFIASLLAAVAVWIAQFITKRLIIVGLALAAAMGSAVVFYVALHDLIGALASYSPPWLTLACDLFLPGNIHLCLTSIASAHAARIVYVWRYRAIFFKANVSYGG